MTRLLVSVRSASEASTALAAGAELIDVKEPRRGALGRADHSTIEEVLSAVDTRVPVSAALGELIDWQGDTAEEINTGLSYIKFGLAGCRRIPAWQAIWGRALAQWPIGIAGVAVAYADFAAADAPEPREVLELADRWACPVVLIDTYDKSHRGLLEHCPLDELARLVDEIRSAGRMAVVAGSLNWESIEQVLTARPDVIAVRSAACLPDRAGDVDSRRVERLAKLVRGKRQTASAIRSAS